MSRSKDAPEKLVGDLHSEILFYGIGMYALQVYFEITSKRVYRILRRKCITPNYDIPEWFFISSRIRRKLVILKIRIMETINALINDLYEVIM